MSELPKPVAWRSRWPELESWKLTEYLDYVPRPEKGRQIDPLFTAEQVAELMKLAELDGRIHENILSGRMGPILGWHSNRVKFRAAYCKSTKGEGS